MKRPTLAVSVAAFAGFATGFWAAVSLFAINVDLLGLPYSNTAVVAQKSAIVENGNIRISIPQGTKLIYQYSAKEQPFYALPIVGEPFTEPFVKADNWNYFWVQNRDTK